MAIMDATRTPPALIPTCDNPEPHVSHWREWGAAEGEQGDARLWCCGVKGAVEPRSIAQQFLDDLRGVLVKRNLTVGQQTMAMDAIKELSMFKDLITLAELGALAYAQVQRVDAGYVARKNGDILNHAAMRSLRTFVVDHNL